LQILAGALIVRAVVATEFLLAAALHVRARAAAAAMPPSAMAREALATTLIVVAVLTALTTLTTLITRRRLRAGDERGQAVVALELVRLLLGRLMLLRLRLLILRRMRLRLLVGLRLLVVLRLLLIRLMLLPAIRLRLLLAETRLPLHRRLALHGLDLLPGLALRVLFSVIERAVPATVVGARGRLLLRLVIGILLPELFLGRGDQTEIVLGVLVMVLGGDVVTRRRGVARKLQVFLGDGVRGSANLHILTVRLVHPRQRIVVMMVVMTTMTMTTLVIAVASSHALVLTVSHGSPVANSHCRR
jgi:hypothetical protein